MPTLTLEERGQGARRGGEKEKQGKVRGERDLLPTDSSSTGASMLSLCIEVGGRGGGGEGEGKRVMWGGTEGDRALMFQVRGGERRSHEQVRASV